MTQTQTKEFAVQTSARVFILMSAVTFSLCSLHAGEPAPAPAQPPVTAPAPAKPPVATPRGIAQPQPPAHTPPEIPADIRDMTNAAYLTDLAQTHLNYGDTDRAEPL